MYLEDRTVSVERERETQPLVCVCVYLQLAHFSPVHPYAVAWQLPPNQFSIKKTKYPPFYPSTRPKPLVLTFSANIPPNDVDMVVGVFGWRQPLLCPH